MENEKNKEFKVVELSKKDLDEKGKGVPYKFIGKASRNLPSKNKYVKCGDIIYFEKNEIPSPKEEWKKIKKGGK